MKRFAALALITLLGGCATYDEYAYSDRGYYDDRYEDRYEDRYYYDRYYASGADYSLSYGSAAYRYGYGPDFITYSTYYSSLWPIYRSYYDPFWSPGFYYGVTYFPRTYFGLNVGWYSWPYYQAYSPYRHSHSDHYYDWMDRSRHNAAYVQRHGGYVPRYGSARNEAQYLARTSGARSAAQGYYGASAQPGGLVDPSYARQARGRGQQLPFERGTRDWNVEPYGRDGRSYRGFTEGATPAGGSARDQVYRRGDSNDRMSQPYDGATPDSRAGRGYGGDVTRDSGRDAPTPNMRGRSQFRDERSFDETPQPNRDADRRYYGGRRGDVTPSAPQTTDREFMERQPRGPYDPIFERHATPRPDNSEEPRFDSRSRNVYRGRSVEQPQSYERSEPVQRNFARPEPRFERSEPSYQRSEPRIERSAPTYERSERAAPSYERSERAAPSFERSEPRPSYSQPDRGSSSDDSGRGSSRGQLERIVRDDE